MSGALHPITGDALRTVADFDRDDAQRLREVVDSMPPGRGGCLRAAAERAGRTLEMLKPALVAVTPHGGLISGSYSRAAHDQAVLVVAEGGRSTWQIVRASWAAALVAEAQDVIAEADDPVLDEAEREGRLLTLVARATLDRWGSRDARPRTFDAALTIGLMLRPEVIRDFVGRVVDAGFAPAIACLVPLRPDGAVLVPIVHGRPWPEAALAEPAGHA